MITKVRNTASWTSVISDLNNQKIVGTLYEKELLKTNHRTTSNRKVIKKKGDKLYLKWKGYDNLFDNWIDKKDVGYNGYI